MSDTRALHGALNRWRDALGQKRNAALKADLIYEAHAKSSAFIKWTAARAQAVDNGNTADKAHAFFVLRSSFKKWNRAIVQRKQQQLADRKRKNDLKAAMDGGYRGLTVLILQPGVMPQSRVSSTKQQWRSSKRNRIRCVCCSACR